MLSMQNMKLLVVGSINMDIFTYVENHPKPGETIKSGKVLYSGGGKGANQAVAASLSGAEVHMLGAVGSDAFGKPLIDSLRGYQVNIENVMVKNMNSGLAFITVEQSGENYIVLSEGANGLIAKENIDKLFAASGLPSAVLVQNEINWDATIYTMEKAKENNCKVYYNAAPAKKVPDDVFELIDVLIINETEAATLTGIEPTTKEELLKVIQQLINRGIEEVIITLGKQGVFYGDRNGERFSMPAFKVTSKDSTAAGDTFVGAYVTNRLLGRKVHGALEYASAAAAIAVTREGAQISIPNKEEVEDFLRRNQKD